MHADVTEIKKCLIHIATLDKLIGENTTEPHQISFKLMLSNVLYKISQCLKAGLQFHLKQLCTRQLMTSGGHHFRYFLI